MGVRGLQQWLYIQSPPKTPVWSIYERTRIGIDILPFLYNAKKQNKCIVAQVASIIEFFRSKQMEPIVFFDGKPPSEKKEVVKERAEERLSVSKTIQILTLDLTDGPDKELVEHEIKKLQRSSPTVTYVERDLIKKFLYTMGVRYLNAMGEADPLLAYWSNTHTLSAIVSPDMDMLPRGVEHLIMLNDAGDWVEYTLSTLLTNISLSLSKFQTMCAFMGTDYTKSVRTIPVRMAYRAVQSTTTLKEAWVGLGQVESDIPLLERACELLDGKDATLKTLLSEKETVRWLADEPTIEPDEFAIFHHTYLSSMHAEFLQMPIPVATERTA